MVPVYVLNLAADQERFRAIQSAVAAHPFLTLHRVPGVDGLALPSAACLPLTRNKWSVNHKGTLACFLGHVRAWELMAASDHAFSLFIEDDVTLHGLEILSSLQIPAGIDLVFCNDRTCYEHAADGPAFLPLPPALAFAARHGQSIGGDGYLLTTAGAAKLLRFIYTDGFFSHVDLRLFAYGLTRDAAAAIAMPDVRIAGDIRAIRMTYDAAHHVETRVLSPYLTRHLGGEGSRRAAADIPILFG